MNFEISADEVEFAHLNVRTEKHGDEDVTAIDLKLCWTTGNEALAHFHPELRRALYVSPDSKQRPVDGVEPPLSARVFPALAPIKWTEEVTGIKLIIKHGIAGKSDLVLGDCTADHFVIESMDGGTVAITFRVRTVCKDERVLGKLGMLLKRDLPMAIEREHPEPAVGSATATPKAGRQQSVEEAFVGTR